MNNTYPVRLPQGKFVGPVWKKIKATEWEGVVVWEGKNLGKNKNRQEAYDD